MAVATDYSGIVNWSVVTDCNAIVDLLLVVATGHINRCKWQLITFNLSTML